MDNGRTAEPETHASAEDSSTAKAKQTEIVYRSLKSQHTNMYIELHKKYVTLILYIRPVNATVKVKQRLPCTSQTQLIKNDI